MIKPGWHLRKNKKLIIWEIHNNSLSNFIDMYRSINLTYFNFYCRHSKGLENRLIVR